ncbi:sulfatase [Candidatus Fermentibacteria bacterium]|nr:sulfatase [Candidatus Fermentibacteria bacterium]
MAHQQRESGWHVVLTRGRSALKFSALVCMTLACTRPTLGVLSLLDQIPEEEPAGPWTAVAFVRERGGPLAEEPAVLPSNLSAHRIRLTSREGLHLPSGGMILARTAYQRRWGEGQVAELAVRRGDSIVATREAPLGPSWQEFRLHIPRDGADALELRCSVPPGTEVPPFSLVAVAMEPSASPAEVRRASSLLAWAARQSIYMTPTLLKWKRFHLALEAGSSEIVTMAGGDTLAFDIPTPFCGGTLKFAAIELKMETGTEAVLHLEVHNRDRWERMADWAMEDRRREVSQRQSFDLPVIGDKIRFTLTGKDELIGLATPMVLPRHASGAGKNLVVIVLDTMRADRLGFYGYETRPTSQALDSLLDARGFSIFHAASSGGPNTLSATPKFLASRYLNIHEPESVPRGNLMLAEMLRSHGYYCAAFTGGGVLQCPGFDQGFHEFHTARGPGKVEEVFPPARVWLETNPTRPFFLFVHTYEPHTPYTRDLFCRHLPHGGLGDISKGELLMDGTAGARDVVGDIMELSFEESLYVEAAYDGGVRVATDAAVELLTLLDRLGLWENTVVVILSDHGEEFWEHTGSYAHHSSWSVYNELLHVPFALREAGSDGGKARHIHQNVSTVDLMPTVVELLRLPSVHPMDGASLAPALRGTPVKRAIPILATSSPRGASPRVCVIKDRMKYCAPDSAGRGPELYDLQADPRELRDLVQKDSARTREMELLLQAGIRAAAKPMASEPAGAYELPDGLRAQLELLGYLIPEERREGRDRGR